MNEIVKFARVNWDRCLAGGALAFGAIALLLGMRGVRDSVYVVQQLPYFISGGLLGIFFLGIGATAWLSADLRDEWRELRALREELEGSVSASGPTDLHELSNGDDNGFVEPSADERTRRRRNGKLRAPETIESLS